MSDGVRLLVHLFRGGSPPSPSTDECGPDPTEDALACESFAPCAEEPGRVPSLTAFTLTPSGRGEFLLYDGPLGSRFGVSHARL